MWLSSVLSACLLLNLSAISFVSEQNDPCSHRVLTVSVKDSEGRAITDLAPADFEAKVHGKPVKILSVTSDARPHRLLLAVDISHSMKNGATGEPPRWSWQFALARHFFGQNHQKAQVALLIFGNQINDVVDFSQGNAAVDAKLQQAAKGPDDLRNLPRGRTTLQEAILEGLQLFDQPSSADAVYLLSDAIESSTAAQGSGDVIQLLNATHVRLFAVLLQQEIGYRNKSAKKKCSVLESFRRSPGSPAARSSAQPSGIRIGLA